MQLQFCRQTVLFSIYHSDDFEKTAFECLFHAARKFLLACAFCLEQFRQ